MPLCRAFLREPVAHLSVCGFFVSFVLFVFIIHNNIILHQAFRSVRNRSDRWNEARAAFKMNCTFASNHCDHTNLCPTNKFFLILKMPMSTLCGYKQVLSTAQLYASIYF